MGLDMYLTARVKLGDRDERALKVFEVIAAEFPDGVPDEDPESTRRGLGLFDSTFGGSAEPWKDTDPRISMVRAAIEKNFPVADTSNHWIGCSFSGDFFDVPLMYWRKANQIHQWFVQNVQGGEDDCEVYDVPREKLADLAKKIGEILGDNRKARKLLRTQGGFFFGSTDYDQWYFEDLEVTAAGFKRMRNHPLTEATTIQYASSW